MRLLHGFLLLAVATVLTGSASAEVLLETEFRRGREGWALNGSARLAPIADTERPQVLQLTSGRTGQAGVAWSELRRMVPSFSFTMDARVRFFPRSTADCPADGMTMVFAPVEKDAIGAPGSSLGLCESYLVSQFMAVEVNTWSGQGLGTTAERADCRAGKNETFAFDVVTPRSPVGEALRFRGGGTPTLGGFKIGQTLPPAGMQVVNGGWHRYQWNAREDGTLSLFVTGLEAGNQHLQKVKVLEVTMGWNPLRRFDGRWGLTASTGDLAQTVDIARVRIEVPAVDPQ